MVKKDKLYLTLENVKPKEQKYYLCEMELNKPKNIFEFSKKTNALFSKIDFIYLRKKTSYKQCGNIYTNDQ